MSSVCHYSICRAFRAPRALDLVALLRDSYVEIDAVERRALLERYARAAGDAPPASSIALMTVQRKCKDLGRYLYVCSVKGDSRYAPFVERARSAVLEALPDLPGEVRAFGERLAVILTAGAGAPEGSA